MPDIFEEDVKALGEKITESLKKMETLPSSRIDYAVWLQETLSVEEHIFTGIMEARWGEDKCNDWMCDVMVASGKFVRDSEGHVMVKTDDPPS